MFLFLASTFASLICAGEAVSVSGSLALDASVALDFPNVVVQLWPLPVFQDHLLPLSKRCVYGIDGNAPAQQILASPTIETAPSSSFHWKSSASNETNSRPGKSSMRAKLCDFNLNRHNGFFFVNVCFV